MTLAQHKTEEHRAASKSKDGSLERVRAAAQELHAAITSAAAKHGEAVKEDLKSIVPKAKAVAASLNESLGVQAEAIKKQLSQAIPHLEIQT